MRGQFESVPLVDISGLGSPDAATRKTTALALDHAARTAGFFYVKNHGLPENLVTGLRDAAARFFRLPQSTKLKYYIGDSKNHRGYVPPGEEVFYGQTKQDTKEAFDLSLELPPSDPDYLAGNRLHGPNVWPSEVESFREHVYAYYEAVVALGRRLCSGLLLALDLPEASPAASGESPAASGKNIDAWFTKPPSQLRLIHYPPQPEAVDAPGIGAHTDYECFTILHATTPGLEVMNAHERWVDAPPIPGAFVINIGDLFEVLSNGRWVSTVHRVRRVREERYSFPLFYNVDYPTEVAPLAHLVALDGERRYRPIRAGEHLWAQTAQTFTYLKRQVERGTLKLPEGATGLAAFAKDRTDRVTEG